MPNSRPCGSRSSPAAAQRCAEGAGLDGDPPGRVTLGRDVRCAATSQPYLGAAPPTPHWARYALLNHPQIPPKSLKLSTRNEVKSARGAPQARQVADRFHLVQNLRDRIEQYLSGRRQRPVNPIE